MEFKDFSERRWEQREKQREAFFIIPEPYEGPAEDDYFCWRWCKRHFCSDLDARMIPSNEIILQSILRSDYLYRFHIDYLYFHHDRQDMIILNQLLELYGDDPEKLASMWQWAKSNSVGRNISRDFPSLYAFQNQLQQDLATLNDLQASVYSFRGSLSVFLEQQYDKMIDRIVECRLEDLGVFASRGTGCDVSFLKRTETTPKRTDKFTNVSIECSVAGSGKTQHVFDQLYQHFGHYLVSGRASIGASPDSFLTARHGMASLDTRYLYELLGPNPEPQAYSQCLMILIKNRQRSLRSAQIFYKIRNDEVLHPRYWLLFQSVCTRDYDPFLETFKLALLCGPPDTYFLSHPDLLPMIEMVCFDEVQCEMTSEQAYTNEPQALDWFLETFRDLQRTYADLRLVLSGTSLQLTQCLQRVEAARLNVYSYIPQSQFQLVKKYPEIFDRFDAVSKYDEFHSLLHKHFKRLIDQTYYLTTLSSEFVKRYKIWEVFMPDNESLSKEEIYGILQTLLWVISRALRLSRLIPRARTNAPGELLEKFVAIVGCCPVSSSEPLHSSYEFLRRSSAMFRGRYRWSILLIEHLFVEVIRRISIFRAEIPNLDPYEIAGHYSKDIVQEQFELVQTQIKDQLKYRIMTLQQRGHHYLLEDLYATAVRADLMHTPCIFRNRESAQMVSEGFALLQPSTTDAAELKQELAEPLVVDAVIEYLRRPEDEEEHRYERYLRELLYHSQDDDSAFGKVAEFYIAWAFGGLLLHQDSIFQTSPRRCYDLLSALTDADLIHRCSYPQPGGRDKLESLVDYALEYSSSRGMDGTALGSKIEFHQWLQCVWKGDFFPTFYFPSNMAGPDIVFCLRHQQKRNERLICAVQVKTGTTKVTGEDSFKLVRTLDPNLWFEGQYQEPRKRLIEELRSHRSDVRVLTILVVTSLEVEKFFASRENLYIGLTNLREPVCRYSMAFEGAVGNTEAQQAQEEYKTAEKAIGDVVEIFLKHATPGAGREMVQAAETVINDEKGPNLKVKKETTKIRQALTYSQNQFSTRLANRMIETGIPDTQVKATIHQFIGAYNKRTETRSTQKQPLEHAKKSLETAAASISSSTDGLQDRRHTTTAGNLYCGETMDFFFTVLERDQLKIILGEAFDELLSAMKGLERRKMMKAVDGSKSGG